MHPTGARGLPGDGHPVESPPKASMFFVTHLKSRDLIERAVIAGCVPIDSLLNSRCAKNPSTPGLQHTLPHRSRLGRAPSQVAHRRRGERNPLYTPPRNHRRTALRRANCFSAFNDCATEMAAKGSSTAALNSSPPMAILIALPPLRLLGERLYQKTTGPNALRYRPTP